MEHVRVTLKYKDQVINWEEPIYELPGETAAENWHRTQYMWNDGNYSCDCNKTMFARQRGFDWPELECGDEVELVSLKRIK